MSACTPHTDSIPARDTGVGHARHKWAVLPINPSVCAGVRRRETALDLVFKLIEWLVQRSWCLNGGATLMQMVLDGNLFLDRVS